METYQSLHEEVIENKKRFENSIKNFNAIMPTIESAKKDFLKLELIKGVLEATFQVATGYFYSTVLETFLTNIAKKYDIENYEVEPQKNSFLHVMTEAYDTGGHTRVVERWVKLAPENTTHSVIMCDPKEMGKVLLLRENIKAKNGEFIELDCKEHYLERALKLRKIALSYEYIILHIHMDDPIATIAFGTEKFTRPVIFFNHADQLFWIGKSISDATFDFKTIKTITASKRLITNNVYKCPIPTLPNTNTPDKQSARKKLDFAPDEKILVTAGHYYKYNSFFDNSFMLVIDEILSSHKDVKLYAIGIGDKNENWLELSKYFDKQLFLLPSINFDEGYLDYIAAADIYLNSYPLGGGTTLIDAINCKTPFVSLENRIGASDFMLLSQGFCKTKEEFTKKIKELIDNLELREEVLQNETMLFEKDHSPKNWQENLKNILSQVPKVHKVKDISKEIEPNEIDDYNIMLHIMYKNLK